MEEELGVDKGRVTRSGHYAPLSTAISKAAKLQEGNPNSIKMQRSSEADSEIINPDIRWPNTKENNLKRKTSH